MSRIPRWLTSHMGWKLLALAIAVLLWISVAGEPELSTFATVPVVFLDLPPDLEISSRAVETVILELRGPSGELREFSSSRDGAVVLDMSQALSGEQTFTISDENVHLPRGIRVVRAIPSQLRFDLQKVTTKAVPVQVRISNPPPEGYSMESETVLPPTLQITGPESAVAATQSVSTDPVDLSGVVGSAEFRVNVFAADPHVRFVAAPRVTVRVTIRKAGVPQPPASHRGH